LSSLGTVIVGGDHALILRLDKPEGYEEGA
jgi:hypothetical protein